MAGNKKIKLNFQIDGIDTTIKNMEDLERVTQDLNDELKKADIGSEEFNKLQRAIAQTSSEMKGLELSMEGLDPEGRASAFGAFAAGMAETATGAVALSGAMGLTNESSTEMVETLVSGMAVAQSFRGGLEGIIAGQKLLKASTIGTTAATTGGSVAMGILNAVMNMNPIFLLITALVTFIALLAIFSAGTNEAAEANENLAAAMESNSKAVERNTALRENQLSLTKNIIANGQKLLDYEAKLLKSKKSLTEADKERIKGIEGEKKALEETEFNAIKDEAVQKQKDNAAQILNEFKYMKNAINATDYEDGVNDINYDAAIKKTNALKAEFVAVNNEYKKTGNIKEYEKATQKLASKASVLGQEMDALNLKLGSAEKEEWKNVITGADNLNTSLQAANKNAGDLVNTLNDKETSDSLNEMAKTEEDIAAQNKAQEESERRKNEYIAAQQKLKEQLLKIDQQIALASIDDSTLAGQEEKALLARQQALENELADIEGNSSKAQELRKKVQQLADIEMLDIRKDFGDKMIAEQKVIDDKATAEADADFAKRLQAEETGQRMLTDKKIAGMSEEADEIYLKKKEIEDLQYQDELANLSEMRANELLADAEYYALVEAAEQEHKDRMGVLDEEETARQEELQSKKREMALQATMGLLGGINDLVQAFAGKSEAAQKKAFKVNQAFQIAQATIDTIKGGISAFTGMVSQIPGPVGIVLGAVAAAGVVASGIASIKKIASTKFQGTGGGGGAPSIPKPSAGTGGDSAPTPPSLSLYGQANEGSQGQGEQGPGLRQQQTIKAVVVESDITKTQNRLNTYQQRSEIG